MKCKGIKDEQAIATLAWHSEDNSSLCLESLETQQTNLQALIALLIEKFEKKKTVNLDVYQMRQRPGETVAESLVLESFLRYLSHLERSVVM